MNSIFEIAKSGLFSARQSLSTVSHNIANANTPGYTRQRSELSAAILRKDGYVFGQGVNVTQVQRLRSDLTDRQIESKNNDLGGLNEHKRIYSQLESTLTTDSGSGLDTQLGQFFNSFSQLTNNPEDMQLRSVLLSKAKSLTGNFHDTANNIEEVARQTKKSAQGHLDEVNRLLQGIDGVNREIARSGANGKPDLDGKDQQSKQLKALSKLVDAHAIYNDDGSVDVRIGGITVLDGDGPSIISAETAPGKNVFRLRLDNGKLIEPGGGVLQADQTMITSAIPGMQQHLNDIAKTLVTEVNNIHNDGYGLNDAVQRNFFNNGNTTAQNISINASLLNNPGNIAASSAPGEAGNADIASRLSSLQDEKVLDGKTLIDNGISMMSEPGNNINVLQSHIDTQQSAKTMLVNQQQSQAGVSIDEELSDMIKFQNAYQASARVLETGKQMVDTLLSIV